jgi:hypothetical protein
MSTPDPQQTEWVPIWNPVSQGPVGPQGPAGPSAMIQDEGVPLTQRAALNFIGTGVLASDDAANNRTNITITGAVTSVFGRSGAVVATTGDYTVAQVTGAVATTRSILTSTGLTGGGDLSANRTLSVVDDTTVQRMRISAGGVLSGTRPHINFVQGINVSVSAIDDPGNNRVSVTIGATFTGVPTTRLINTSTGLSGGGDLSADRTLMVVADTTTQRVRISKAGTLIATRQQVNFIEGSNTTLTVADDSVNNRVNITIASAAGGQNQSPWLSNIDAATFSLGNVGTIGVGTSAPVDANTLLRLSSPVNAVAKMYIECVPYYGYSALYLSTYGAVWQLGAGSTGTAADGFDGKFYIHDETHGATRFAINSFGNIGVGIANPAYQLDVAGDLNYTGTFRKNGVAVTFGGSQTPWLQNIDAAKFNLNNLQMINIIDPTAGNSAATGQILLSVSFGGLILSSNQNILLNPASGKKVGINSSLVNPAYMLDVAGDCNITGVYRVNGVPISTGGSGQNQSPWLSNINAAGYLLSNVGQIQIAGVNVGGVDRFTAIKIDRTYDTVGDSADISYGVAGRFSMNAIGGGESGFIFYAQTGAGDGTNNEVMRVQGNGRVGIATASPRGTLDVNGSSYFSNNLYFTAGAVGSGAWYRSADAVDRIFEGFDGPSNTVWRIYAGLSRNAIAIGAQSGTVGINLPTVTVPAAPLEIRAITNGSDTVRVCDTTGTKFFIVKPEVAPGVCSLAYWQGSYGTIKFEGGPVTMDSSLTVTGGISTGADSYFGNIYVNNTAGNQGITMRIDGYGDHMYLATSGGGDVILLPNGVNAFVAASGAVSVNVQLNSNAATYTHYIEISSDSSGTTWGGAAMHVREVTRGGGSGYAAGDGNWSPRIAFHWSGGYASQIGMEWGGRIAIWNNPGTAYEALVCGAFTCASVQSSGQVNGTAFNATTYNGYTISTSAGGGYRIVATDVNGYTYMYYMNSTMPQEGFAPAEFVALNGSDTFIRKVSAQTAANKIYSMDAPAPINSINGAGGTLGFVAGHGRGVSQYGAMYWTSSNAALNLYHSGIAGYVMTITTNGIHIPFMQTSAVAGGGMLWRDVNGFVHIVP